MFYLHIDMQWLCSVLTVNYLLFMNVVGHKIVCRCTLVNMHSVTFIISWGSGAFVAVSDVYKSWVQVRIWWLHDMHGRCYHYCHHAWLDPSGNVSPYLSVHILSYFRDISCVHYMIRKISLLDMHLRWKVDMQFTIYICLSTIKVGLLHLPSRCPSECM
jgi:hypothetical protein